MCITPPDIIDLGNLGELGNFIGHKTKAQRRKLKEKEKRTLKKRVILVIFFGVGVILGHSRTRAFVSGLQDIC